MKQSFLFFLFATLIWSCKTDAPSDTVQEVKQYSIEQFMNNTRIYGSSISHDDGKILIGNDKTGTFNAYTISVDGGDPVAMTNYDKTVRPISFFPNDNRFPLFK